MSLLVRLALQIRRGPARCLSGRLRTRTLATYHDSNSFSSTRARSTQSGASSLLSQVEAEIAAKRGQGGTSTSGTGVGPFQLGISPESLRGSKAKQWSELSAGGKGKMFISVANAARSDPTIQPPEPLPVLATSQLFSSALVSLPCSYTHSLPSSLPKIRLL
jgi:hypothetical protein